MRRAARRSLTPPRGVRSMPAIMQLHDEVLDALRHAVELSPDSGPLRRHYAEMLLNRGYARQAEEEFRKAIDLDGLDAPAKLGLARALHSQNQNSTALLLVKQVIRDSDRPAKAYILYARLLLALGSVERAAREYRRAIATDPEVVDPDLASELGLASSALGARGDDREATQPPDAEISPAEAYTYRLRRLFAAQPRVTFEQVAGLERIRRELNAMLVHPLNHRDLYRTYDRPLGGRLLLYGPPGSGKTFLARAVAGEVLAPFFAVHIHDLMDRWREQSGRMLHAVFGQAREVRPSVLFFDELETAGTLSPVSRQLNRELTAGDANEGVLVLAATNAPWDADQALLAPGRFDRVLFVRPPSRADRLEALRRLCADKPRQELDLPALADATAGFTFGDLERLVDRAVDSRLAASLDRGRPEPLDAEALLDAAHRITPSAPAWLEEAKEILATSRHPAGVYDELERYLAERED